MSATRRGRAGRGSQLITSTCCIICADHVVNGHQNKKKTNWIHSWDKFLSLFGGGSSSSIGNVFNSSSLPPPICPTCDKVILQLVGLSEKLAQGMESLERKLLESEGRFVSCDASILNLRSQLVTVRRRNKDFVTPSISEPHYHNQSYPTFSDLIYTPAPQQNTLSMPTLFPEHHQQQQQQLYVPGNVQFNQFHQEPPPPLQYLVLANNQEVCNSNLSQMEENDDYDPSGLDEENGSSSDEDSTDSSDDNDEEDSLSNNTPRKRTAVNATKVIQRRPTVFKRKAKNIQEEMELQLKRRKMAPESIAKMLESRKKRFENFAPLIKTDDGRMFYENYEILQNPESRKLSCKTCGWTERNKSSSQRAYFQTKSMKIHIKGVHLGSYNCTSCTKTFRSLPSLKFHKAIVCSGKDADAPTPTTNPHSCTVCGKSFFNLKFHLWTHKSVEEKKAAIAAGDVPASFVKHRQTVPCDQCGKFFLRYNLERHKMSCGKVIEAKKIPVITDASPTKRKRRRILKNSQCTICGLITYPTHIVLHMETHKDPSEGKRMWKCPIEGCGYTCRYTAFVKRMSHMRSVHNTTSRELRGVKRFYCKVPDCTSKKCFRSSQNLDQHMLKLHTPYVWTKWTCGVCSCIFKFERDLKYHKWKRHRGDDSPELYKFECSICSVKFKTEPALKAHVTNFHIKKRKQTNKQLGTKGIAIDEKQYEEMVKSADKKGNNTCSVCGRIFNTLKQYIEHVKYHLSYTLTPCLICGCPVPCHSVNHKRRLHDWSHLGLVDLVQAINSGKRIPSDWLESKQRTRLIHFEDHGMEIACEICLQNDFKTVLELQQHFDAAHQGVKSTRPKKKSKDSSSITTPKIVGNFECSTCSSRYLTNKGLNRHIREKHQLNCFMCSEKFDKYSALRSHIELIHPEKLKQKSKKSIQLREVVIEGEEELSPSLTMAINVKQYWETIVKARKTGNYTCEFCGMAMECNSFEGLRHHAARHISKNDSAKTKKKILPCEICQRPFPSVNGISSKPFRDHKWTHMGVAELVEAVNCGKRIPADLLARPARPRSCRQNLIHWEDHGLQIECGKCQENDFTTAAALQQHILTAHPIIIIEQNQVENQQIPSASSSSSNVENHLLDRAILNLDPILTSSKYGSKYFAIGKNLVARLTADNKIKLLSEKEAASVIQPVVVVLDDDDDVICLD